MFTALALAAGLVASPVTYNTDVAPVIARRCGGCHRAGGAAPFTLTTFADVRRRATMIVDAVTRRYMPPWMPDPTASAPFERDPRLSAEEMAIVARWADDGFLEGTPVDRPTTPTASREWALGPPDLIVTAESYLLAAEGDDVFRTFVARVPQGRVRYVRAFEFRASSGTAVHHANIKLDRTDSSRALDLAEAGPGYEGSGGRNAVFPDGHFLGWTPGQSPRVRDDGLTWSIPPGADVVFELHMAPTGKPEVVQASVALYFSDVPPARSPVMIRLGRQDIDIPAGQSDYISEDSYVLPVPATVLALQPHAHLLAHGMQGWATRPDGSVEPLIAIPRWNASWQETYVLRRPLHLPAGSRLSMSFRYDNSPTNPRSASPPRRVTFGQATRSEMGDLWIQVMPDSDGDRGRLFADVSKMMLRADIDGVEMMLASGPDSAKLRVDLAFCYVEAGRPSDAVIQLRHAVRLAPESAPTRHDLATLLLRQHLYDEARAELLAAVRLRPDFFEAFVNLGVADFAQGQPARAARWYERSLAIAPRNATAHYNIAVAYETLGDRSRAREHYEQAVALAPDDVEALVGLARLLAVQGQAKAAATRYRQALALQPRNPGALLDLAWILSTSGDAAVRAPREAIQLAELARTDASVDLSTVMDVLAAAYASDCQTARAVDLAKEALRRVTEARGSVELRDGIARRLASYERLQAQAEAR